MRPRRRDVTRRARCLDTAFCSRLFIYGMMLQMMAAIEQRYHEIDNMKAVVMLIIS